MQSLLFFSEVNDDLFWLTRLHMVYSRLSRIGTQSPPDPPNKWHPVAVIPSSGSFLTAPLKQTVCF